VKCFLKEQAVHNLYIACSRSMLHFWYMKTISKYIPHVLFAAYCIEFAMLSIHPYSRAVWYAENTPIVAIVLFLVVLYIRGIRFSNTAYILMAILPYMHTIGGYYTFERVPFDWFNHFFGFERNMFDRVGHFSVGFYAVGLGEYLIKFKKVTTKFWAYFTGICFIMAVAALYEIIEWQYAVKEGGDAGIAFLGSQGDIWDAQKDMLMDTLGACTGVVILMVKNVFSSSKQG
jgi:putative membrane protein